MVGEQNPGVLPAKTLHRWLINPGLEVHPFRPDLNRLVQHFQAQAFRAFERPSFTRRPVGNHHRMAGGSRKIAQRLPGFRQGVALEKKIQPPFEQIHLRMLEKSRERCVGKVGQTAAEGRFRDHGGFMPSLPGTGAAVARQGNVPAPCRGARAAAGLSWDRSPGSSETLSAA